MDDLLEGLGLPDGSAVASVGAGDGLSWPGLRRLAAEDLAGQPGRAFDVVVLDDVLRQGTEAETLLAASVRVVRDGGLLVVRQRGSGMSLSELCAHFAGEWLGVEEQMVDDEGRTTWLLRVYPAEPSPAGDR